MDLAQERRRLQALDEYGVKTTRQWNAYHREWERQHPLWARVRSVALGALVWAYSIAFWTVALGAPVYYLLKGH